MFEMIFEVNWFCFGERKILNRSLTLEKIVSTNSGGMSLECKIVKENRKTFKNVIETMQIIYRLFVPFCTITTKDNLLAYL